MCFLPLFCAVRIYLFQFLLLENCGTATHLSSSIKEEPKLYNFFVTKKAAHLLPLWLLVFLFWFIYSSHISYTTTFPSFCLLLLKIECQNCIMHNMFLRYATGGSNLLVGRLMQARSFARPAINTSQVVLRSFLSPCYPWSIYHHVFTFLLSISHS